HEIRNLDADVRRNRFSTSIGNQTGTEERQCAQQNSDGAFHRRLLDRACDAIDTAQADVPKVHSKPCADRQILPSLPDPPLTKSAIYFEFGGRSVRTVSLSHLSAGKIGTSLPSRSFVRVGPVTRVCTA